MMKDWIVYQTPEDKIEAVEDNKTGLQSDELRSELNVIVGYVAFTHMKDAVMYCKQVLL